MSDVPLAGTEALLTMVRNLPSFDSAPDSDSELDSHMDPSTLMASATAASSLVKMAAPDSCCCSSYPSPDSLPVRSTLGSYTLSNSIPGYSGRSPALWTLSPMSHEMVRLSSPHRIMAMPQILACATCINGTAMTPGPHLRPTVWPATAATTSAEW